MEKGKENDRAARATYCGGHRWRVWHRPGDRAGLCEGGGTRCRPGGRREAGAATVKHITGAGGKASSLRLDDTEREKCREVAAQTGTTIAKVSILVNNAGINRRNAFTADPQAVIKDWQDIM